MKRRKKSAQEGLAGGGGTVPKPSRKGKGPAPKLTLTRNSSLAVLAARGTLDQRQLAAALQFRERVRTMTGGMPAKDWMREKVDGGRQFIGPSGALTGALDAERQVREMVAKSGMGVAEAEVVWRVAGLDEALKVVAVDFEVRGEGESMTDFAARLSAARLSLAASQQAQRHVSRLLKDGLTRLADLTFGRQARRSEVAQMMSEWLTVQRAR